MSRAAGPLAAAVLAAAVLTGCLAGHPRLEVAEAAPAFVPERFFAGPTHGVGTLRVRARRARPVTVESRGEADAAGVFHLRQRVTVGDATTCRAWTMRRTADGGLAATLSEAPAGVSVRADGARLHIRYALPGLVRVRQTLALRPGGASADNRLTAFVLGVPIARLDEEIRRGPAPPAPASSAPPRDGTEHLCP